MKRNSIIALLLICGILMVTGCTGYIRTDTNRVPPALKTLLVMKEAIVLTGETADALCTQGLLTRQQCDEISKLYYDSQPAYDAAADALIIALRAPDENAEPWERYSYLHEKFLTIYTDMVKLAVTYGLVDTEAAGGAK